MVLFIIEESVCNAKDAKQALFKEENFKKGSPWKLHIVTLGCTCKSSLTGTVHVNAS